MSRYKAVIFDMDGVILDTEKLLTKYWCRAAREYGFDMQMKHALHIRSLWGEWASEYLKSELGASFDYMAVRKRRKELMNSDLEANGIPLKNGVNELLSELERRNIKKAVCTATDFERTEKYLKKLNLFDRFDKIVCAPDVRIGKPAPDIYLLACEEIGSAPSECLALEDSPNGIKSAFSAGLDVLMIPDLTEPSDTDRKYIIGSANDLSEAVLYL